MELMMIDPFKNDSQVLNIGGLCIENGLDSIQIYGELIIRPDQDGLTQAKALHEFAQALILALEQPIIAQDHSTPPLPERIDNPFA